MNSKEEHYITRLLIVSCLFLIWIRDCMVYSDIERDLNMTRDKLEYSEKRLYENIDYTQNRLYDKIEYSQERIQFNIEHYCR